MGKQYHYQPLCQSTNEIRLLKILPSSENSKLKNIPSCRIVHTSLKQNPKFAALSYVWGDTQDVRVILLENCPVKVTANLYDAMIALRRPDEPLSIWIDSLCIDQANNEEKSWQVGLMHDIYSQAWKVLAWLGPADQSSDSVILYLDELGKRAEACGFSMSPQSGMELWQFMVSDPEAMFKLPEVVCFDMSPNGGNMVSKYALADLWHSIDGSHGPNSRLPIQDLKNLFARSWWSRIWVLQEIALAKHADFVCGHSRISRDRLRAAYNAMYALWETVTLQWRRRQQLTSYQMEVSMNLGRHKPKLMLSAWGIYHFARYPLLALLRATSVGSVHLIGPEGYQHLESTDPRDKIFALLCLAEDREDLENKGVIPDYTKSKEQVFTTVTAALLQQEHVALLSFCRGCENPPGLPSWVPDWSQPRPEALQDVDPDHMTLNPEFNASGVKRSPSVITVLRDDASIRGILATCYVYDKIYEVGNISRVPLTDTCLSDSQWLREILRLSYLRPSIYQNFHERLRAVVMDSIHGVIFGHNSFLEKVEDDFLDDCCVEAAHILQNGLRRIPQQDIKKELNAYLARKPWTKQSRNIPFRVPDLQLEYMRLSRRKSPFVTEKGNLGLSTWHVQKGDVVALISGAQVPFVLRHRPDGKYMIVGETYLNHVMDGEVAGNATWQSLEIT